ncbi:hypothetical protein BXL21_25210 [Salmonella enterica subsp. enterica serovar Enteritidis]|nr:hypothetical protein [Salmonella enterica subsp. enterica serovar Enteritidis]
MNMTLYGLLTDFWQFVLMHAVSLVVSFLGGVVLSIIKLVEHFHRDERAKLTWGRYILYAIFCLVLLPFLGSLVTGIYLASGDKIQPVLAFQIGLSSPAMVSRLLSGIAEKQLNTPIPVEAGA